MAPAEPPHNSLEVRVSTRPPVQFRLIAPCEQLSRIYILLRTCVAWARLARPFCKVLHAQVLQMFEAVEGEASVGDHSD